MADKRKLGKHLTGLAGMKQDPDEIQAGYGIEPEFRHGQTFYKGTNIPYGPHAYTRFTKTPIYFQSPEVYEGTELSQRYKDEDYVPGQFHPATVLHYDQLRPPEELPAQIHITAGRRNPYWTVGETVAHEDVHAALEKGGAQNLEKGKYPPIVSYPWSYPDHPAIGDMFSMRGIEQAAEKGFREHNLAGSENFELPAYIAASPRSLGPEFNEDMRQLYLKSFETHLPAEVAALIRRIAENYNTSLKSPFVTVTPQK